MQRARILIAGTSILIMQIASADWKELTQWDRQREAEIRFLDKAAWGADGSQSCATFVFNSGALLNSERHIIAAGRGIYGYIYGGRQHTDRLKANAMSNFVQFKMVDWDHPLPYFRSLVHKVGNDFVVKFKDNELSNNSKDHDRKHPSMLRVNEQFYGLTGLLAEYHRSHDAVLLETIKTLYQAWKERFEDPETGGYFEGYDMDNQRPIKTRSFASTVYPITAFLFSLLEVERDADEQRNLRKKIEDLLDLAITELYDERTGIVHEKPLGQRPTDGRPFFISGHNFQFAWALLEAVRRNDYFYLFEKGDRYKRIAQHIIHRQRELGALDWERGGIYDGVFADEAGGLVWGDKDGNHQDHKDWWQQGYAILAMTLAEVLGLMDRDTRDFRDRTLAFYQDFFVARDGGIYARLSADGRTVLSEFKGDAGHWAFHATEMPQFMRFYAQPISDAEANNSYPNEAISGGSAWDSSPEGRRQRAFRGPVYRRTLPDIGSRW